MTQLTLNSTVGQWVAKHPRTSRVFESLKLDFCCGGNKPLAQACLANQLNPIQVLSQLDATVVGEQSQSEINWLEAPLADLCDHIEQTHHAYLKQELPRLAAMIAKVVNAHGAAHPRLADVQQVFGELTAELVPHMAKEEQVLFPAIRQLEQADQKPMFPFGTVANPIRMMEHEHDGAGDALSQLNELTDTYDVPGGACNTYRAMLDGLRELELDMHQHVHKENNILFPRAIQLEIMRTATA